MFCCFSWEKPTKYSQNPGLVNQFSATLGVQLNWTGPIANSSELNVLVQEGQEFAEKVSERFPFGIRPHLPSSSPQGRRQVHPRVVLGILARRTGPSQQRRRQGGWQSVFCGCPFIRKPKVGTREIRGKLPFPNFAPETTDIRKYQTC